MNIRHFVRQFLTLILLACALPLAAQTSPSNSGRRGQLQPQVDLNEIFCANGTACKTGFVPLFTSNGGNATIGSSIMSQSGFVLKIAGSETTTGNANVGGNVNATGAVNSSLGMTTPTLTTSTSVGGISSTMTGNASGVGAIQGSATATGAAGFTFGVIGQSASDQGRGVFGLATGAMGVGLIGETNNTGIGVVGKTLDGRGLAFAATGNVQQDRTSGGWVKGMVFVNTYQPPYTIQRCFNSTLTGSAATTPPCGFNLLEQGPGVFNLDFGFEIDDRFVSANTYGATFAAPSIIPVDPHTFQVVWYDVLRQQVGSGEYYWMVVY